jgi:hypothetical protein
LTDGAPEMRDELRMALNEETRGEPVHKRIDLWRVIEKLGKAAVVTRDREGNAPTQRWKMALLHQSGVVGAILEKLRQSGKEHAQVGEHQPAHEAITCFTNHGGRMKYAQARRQGLSLESGETEANVQVPLREVPEAERRAVEGENG